MSQSMPTLPSLGRTVPGRPRTCEPQVLESSASLPSLGRSGRPQTVDLSPTAEEKSPSQLFPHVSNTVSDARLQNALVQRDVLAHMRATSASAPLQGIDAFKGLLQHRFGTITAAWRQMLDPDGIGKVSFQDFCQCCRDLGFHRKMKQLWSELDTNRKGWITLDHIDPEAAQLLRDFQSAAQTMHKGLLNAWYFFDVKKQKRVDVDDFVEQCKQMNLEGNHQYLFQCLKIDVTRPYLSIQDFDGKSMQCLYRGDMSMMTIKEKGTPSPSRGEADRPGTGFAMPPIPRPGTNGSPSTDIMAKTTGSFDFKKKGEGDNMHSLWTGAISDEQVRVREENTRKQEEYDMGMKCLEELKRELIGRFGSIFAGWRQALDLDGNHRLSFGELCLAMRSLGYKRNVKQLWVALNLNQDKDGFITLGALDPKSHEEISGYRKAALAKFPHMLAVWRESLDAAGSGHIEESTFVQHCTELGWSGDAKSLFHNFKEDRGRKFMTLRDFDIKACDALSRGDMEMLSEKKVELGQHPRLGFQERQDACFSQRRARMHSKLDRSDSDKMQTTSKKEDRAAASADALKQLLIRRCGTLTAAWKHVLDVNCYGRLAFGEFCHAMRRLGYDGELRLTFTGIDLEEKGSITLKDLDSSAHEAVSQFRALLLEKFGTYIKGWESMDPKGKNALQEGELVEFCRSIGYAMDPSKLFKYLLDMPGKKQITMADIDPAAMKAYWRGNVEAMSPMKKAQKQPAARQGADREQKEKRIEASMEGLLSRSSTLKTPTSTKSSTANFAAPHQRRKPKSVQFGNLSQPNEISTSS